MRTSEQFDYTGGYGEFDSISLKSLSPHLRTFYKSVENDIGAYFDGKYRYCEANKICDGIWIGGHAAALNRDFLLENRITSLLNMAIEIDYYPAEGVHLTKIGIHDGESPRPGCFEKAADVIYRARSHGANILVHCAAGISRSVTATISYFMLYEKMKYWDALSMIRENRRQASPHPLLVRSLIRDFGPRFLS